MLFFFLRRIQYLEEDFLDVLVVFFSFSSVPCIIITNYISRLEYFSGCSVSQTQKEKKRTKETR